MLGACLPKAASMSRESSTDIHLPPDHPEEAFLDTSIHLSRFKHDEIRKLIRDVLARFRLRGTASYTKLEFGRALLSEVWWVLDRLRKEGSLDRLHHYMTNVLPANRRKKLWFQNLLARYFNEPDATARAIAALETLLTLGTAFVDNTVEDVRDGIACPWADQMGTQRRWQSPRCQSKTSRCRLPAFFGEHKELFLGIRKAIRDLPAGRLDERPQLARFAEIIERAAEDPEYLRSHSVCTALGDAIIAVQSYGYQCMFTQDYGESSVLCRVLRQLHVLLPAKLGRPVQSFDYRTPPGTQGTAG